MTTFRQLLHEFEEASTSTVDKGRIFEDFCQQFFKNEPIYQQMFDEVWLWQQWLGREGETDSGVDLVARQRSTGKLIAIQCKFYNPSAIISQSKNFLTTQVGQ